MQGFHCFCTALSFPGKVPYSVRLRCKSAGDLRVFSCQALSLVGPPKISSRRKQRRRCFRWPQACTKEKESQGDRGINPVLTLVLCRESPFTLFGFCASHNARRCSEAWRLILCYVLGVSNTPILLYFLISSPYHLQRVAFPTVVKFLLDICQNFAKFKNRNFMRRGRTTITGKSKRRMKFRACGPFPAHALRSYAVPSEMAHGAFAMLLHSKGTEDRHSPQRGTRLFDV